MIKIAHIKQPDFLPLSESFIHRPLALSEQSFEHFILTHHRDNLDRFPLDAHIYELDALPAWRRQGNLLAYKLLRFYPYYNRALRQENAQLIHAHFGHTGWFSRKLARRRDLPLLVSFYGYEIKHEWKTDYWKKRYPVLFREAQYFTCSSQWMAKAMMEWGCPAEKLRVIPVGIDLAEFPPSPKAWDGRAQLQLLYVGRFHEEKGLAWLLNAVARLKPTFDHFHLDLIGFGPEAVALRKRMEELKITDHVSLHENLSRPKTVAFFENCHVFILPSLLEAQGIVIQEAGASYTPVIATNIQGIPEGVRDRETGLLVPPRDASAIVEAIQHFVDHPEDIANFGKAGRKFVEEKFDARMTVQAFQEVWRDLTK